MSGKPIKRWFSVLGQPGDRTLKQQMTGLEQLVERIEGKTVLDVGCAEGLTAMQLFDEGASAVHGLEIVPEHVLLANKLRGDRACTFEVADANDYEPRRQYDVVLMLALLQKVRNPSQVAERFARAAREMVVLRLPPRGKDPLIVVDERSGGHPHNITQAMHAAGFMLKAALRGHLDEHITYWERIK